ncbi:MAG: hypothetical protein Harvfovirus5_9 [Harvfovirus sp.]|uniref:DUF1737 domain-containing protein n=1 Tax=Harvfovirus sp. TaxID=2487768 RepID=A0A3G5A0I9_9VIRU|nr:MAG: hypothetical protein Harvfovirus5_9 [Harvfovirus sp.]
MATKKVEYKLVCDNDPAGLSTIITAHMANGWKLFGQPTQGGGYARYLTHCQAILKEVPTQPSENEAKN